MELEEGKTCRSHCQGIARTAPESDRKSVLLWVGCLGVGLMHGGSCQKVLVKLKTFRDRDGTVKEENLWNKKCLLALRILTGASEKCSAHIGTAGQLVQKLLFIRNPKRTNYCPP